MQDRSTKRAGAVAMTVLVAAFGLAGAMGCGTGNPPPGDAAYKSGSLNQGGFLFACRAGVECSQWSTGDAKNFPHAVALGSTFNIRFVPNADQNQPVDIFSTTPTPDGITVAGLEPFFTGGPEGMDATEREGYGAIVAQKADGTIVDFIDLQVLQPESLTVYDADSTSKNPVDVGDAVKLTVNAPKTFRAVGLDKEKQPLAGIIELSWVSADPTSVNVDHTDDGVATVVAQKATTGTKLTLTGGGFSRDITITVQ